MVEAGGGADGAFLAALFEEGAKKSSLVWVTVPDGSARALWHVWHEGAVLIVGDGPGEQPLFGLADGGGAEVAVRSKDKGGRLARTAVRVSELAPGGEEWTAAVDQLRGKRLNAPDFADTGARWSRECRVLKLTPVQGRAAAAEEGWHGSGAAVPLPTTATTRAPVRKGWHRKR